MSKYYKESNREGTRELFYKRVMYKSYVYDVRNEIPRSRDHIVNFTVAEKALYGRVGIDYLTIKPVIHNELQKNFNSTLVSGQIPMKALNFVVDAFTDMAVEFKKCMLKGQIDNSDTYLSELKVYKAQEDFDNLYARHLRIYKDAIFNNFRDEDEYVLDFDEFTKKLMSMVLRSSRRYPLTQAAYGKSRLCPMGVSGLVVEIADLEYANDSEKLASFMSSPNWDFYINAANKYGFMIDFNAPWRLVADIKSTGMLAYANTYNVGSFAAIMATHYENAYIKHYDNFKRDLLSIYNRVKRTKIEPIQCGGETTLKESRPIEYFSMIDFDKQFGHEYFLELYFKIRIAEEESNFDQASQDKLIRDCLKVYTSHGANDDSARRALAFFETILNHPFDYRGSLSYIINEVVPRRKATELEEIGVFDDDEGEPIQVTGTAAGGGGTTGGGGGY